MTRKERRYTPAHHWAQPHSSGVRVGITVFAQEELGEITYVDLPKIGAIFARGDAVCAIDALKAATELYAPVGGTVIAVNEQLLQQGLGRLINDDAEGAGWIFALGDVEDDELEELMDGDHYRRLIAVIPPLES